MPIAFRCGLEYVSWSESYTVLRCHDGDWWALVHVMHFGFVARDLEMAVVLSLLKQNPILLPPAASLPV